MAETQIIAICQSGGEFTTDKDGTLSYKGGKAHAIDIEDGMKFDDFMKEVSEVFKCNTNSVSIKYFLPSNKKTLITVSNDKDLNRLIKFYRNNITADVYIVNEEAVPPDQSNMPDNRKTNRVRREPNESPEVEAVPPDQSNMPGNRKTNRVRREPNESPGVPSLSERPNKEVVPVDQSNIPGSRKTKNVRRESDVSPEVPNLPERPKKSRARESGEPITVTSDNGTITLKFRRFGQIHLCGNCKQEGHTKRKCPLPLVVREHTEKIKNKGGRPPVANPKESTIERRERLQRQRLREQNQRLNQLQIQISNQLQN